MSLYLKMLEGQLPPNWQREWLENELLPSLDNNILCGNSLIDSNDFDRYLLDTHGELFPLDDVDIRFRMNRFDWTSRTRGFGRLLEPQGRSEDERPGFDCIIGNPPYIRVQELKKWAPEECEFYKWRYESAKKGSYDIYVVFAERCLELLAADGLLGFIMPHKFWQAKYGAGLRKLIADGRHLRSVIDFGDQQVFRGATTYTAVHVLGKHPMNRAIYYAKVLDLSDGNAQCTAIDARKNIAGVRRCSVDQPADEQPWHFHDAGTREFLQQLNERAKPLFPDCCSTVFQGIVTGADPVFLSVGWEPHPKRKSLIRLRSQASQQFVDVEKAIVVPVVRRQGFDAYVAQPSEFLILPYDREKEQLISAEEMASRFPMAWKYLNDHRDALAAREDGRFKQHWWGLSRAQNIRRWSRSKVLVPYMVNRLQAVYDANGTFFVNVTTGGYGLELGAAIGLDTPEDDSLFMVALLNSSLLDYCLRCLSSHFHSGYYPANKQYLQHLPIMLPTTTDEKRIARRMIDSVRRIVGVKTELLRSNLSDRERKSLEGDVELHERRIDEAVLRLYRVDKLPN